ncbi:transmembrane_emp24 domain-containing protein [Hexamita inflata]|uniref:Transmembrane_emp24 domain-containing protein n=1 Tax=Hexamita inflata TaxID=28002 RepID=A0ABP1HQA8_9EUKA
MMKFPKIEDKRAYSTNRAQSLNRTATMSKTRVFSDLLKERNEVNGALNNPQGYKLPDIPVLSPKRIKEHMYQNDINLIDLDRIGEIVNAQNNTENQIKLADIQFKKSYQPDIQHDDDLQFINNSINQFENSQLSSSKKVYEDDDLIFERPKNFKRDSKQINASKVHQIRKRQYEKQNVLNNNSNDQISLKDDFENIDVQFEAFNRIVQEENEARQQQLELIRQNELKQQKINNMRYMQEQERKRKEKIAEEAEKKRLEELEKKRLEELEKKRLEELEKKRLEELEKKRLEELEKKRLEELEKKRLEEAEKKKLEELEKKRLEELEKKRLEEAEKKRLEELEKKRLEELEKKRLEEAEKKRLEELEKKRLAEKKKQVQKLADDKKKQEDQKKLEKNVFVPLLPSAISPESHPLLFQLQYQDNVLLQAFKQIRVRVEQIQSKTQQFYTCAQFERLKFYQYSALNSSKQLSVFKQQLISEQQLMKEQIVAQQNLQNPFISQIELFLQIHCLIFELLDFVESDQDLIYIQNMLRDIRIQNRVLVCDAQLDSDLKQRFIKTTQEQIKTLKNTKNDQKLRLLEQKLHELRQKNGAELILTKELYDTQIQNIK